MLSLAELSKLLLADPQRSMPAIRSLTGKADPKRATAIVRTWDNLSADGQRRIVSLMAADIVGRAGRTVPPARAAARNRDGSISTVSGGLPGLGKRR
jgi:hypothetical protein